jgi:hypothetical protein
LSPLSEQQLERQLVLCLARSWASPLVRLSARRWVEPSVLLMALYLPPKSAFSLVRWTASLLAQASMQTTAQRWALSLAVLSASHLARWLAR